MAVLDAAETILTDQAREMDSFELMRNQEPHHLADLRAQLDADDEAEFVALESDSEEAQIIDLAGWVAEANRTMK